MDIVLIASLTFIASTIGTIFGFGTSTTMIPLLALILPIPQTLLLVGIIHFFGDIWKLILFRVGIRWPLILMFTLPGIITAYFGATLVFVAPEILLSQLLGGFLIIYIIFLLLMPDMKIPQHPINTIAGGALTGFSAGIFGISGAIRSVFLTAFNLEKTVYLATVGASAILIDVTRITTYLIEGTHFKVRLIWGLLLFIPMSYLGALTAKYLVNKIPQPKFRPLIASFILLVGIKLLLFP